MYVWTRGFDLEPPMPQIANGVYPIQRRRWRYITRPCFHHNWDIRPARRRASEAMVLLLQSRERGVTGSENDGRRRRLYNIWKLRPRRSDGDNASGGAHCPAYRVYAYCSPDSQASFRRVFFDGRVSKSVQRPMRRTMVTSKGLSPRTTDISRPSRPAMQPPHENTVNVAARQ